MFDDEFNLTFKITLYNREEEKNKNENVNPGVSGDTRCVFCLDNVSTVALNPCGHVVSCHDCEKKLYENCPICRSAISNTLRIFFP